MSFERGMRLKKKWGFVISFIVFFVALGMMGNVMRRENDIKTKLGENEKEEKNEKVMEIETISKELWEEYYESAQKMVEKMSLEEKVDQLFLVRYPGDNAKTEVKTKAPGGYILFARDFKDKTKEEMTLELNNLQNESKVPLLLAVDEEGGSVVRVSAYEAFRSTPFKAPQKFDTLEALLEESKEKSMLLKSIGLNMNLTPVVDVTENTNAFIYARTYGKDATMTAQYADALIRQMNQDDMIASMKHFPGYGDNVDTHTGIAIDERSKEEFETVDFLPFISGIKVGAPTILVNHNVVKCMDEKMPASLSKNVHDVLRNELDFSGVIVTDDLAMDAVKSYVENGEAAVQAVLSRK